MYVTSFQGYDHIRIDGRTPVETRQLLCDRFQHDESCLVAVLSITTANAGEWGDSFDYYISIDILSVSLL